MSIYTIPKYRAALWVLVVFVMGGIGGFYLSNTFSDSNLIDGQLTSAKQGVALSYKAVIERDDAMVQQYAKIYNLSLDALELSKPLNETAFSTKLNEMSKAQDQLDLIAAQRARLVKQLPSIND